MRIGILDHESLRLGGGQLVVAHMAALLAREHEIEIIHAGKGYDVGILGEAFALDLSGVADRVIGDLPRSFAIPGPRSAATFFLGGSRYEERLTRPYDVFVYSGHGIPPFSAASNSLVYCHFPFEAAPHVALQRSVEWQHRGALDRWVRGSLYNRIWARRLLGYNCVLANSRFSAQWIRREWDLQPEVVYPPVVANPPHHEKENLIVSVGRFVDTDRKRLALQVELFPRFHAEVGGDWRLAIVGFCTELQQDRAFLDELGRRARGLPIDFLVNASREQVISQVARAKIYWHTTGMAGPQEVEPRHMEHFGIATVEAMRSGCVPVVPAAGGQPEIVRHGVDGFVCGSVDDLVAATCELARDPELCSAMSERARARSRVFGPGAFDAKLLQILGEL